MESFGSKILSQVTTKLGQLHSNSRNKGGGRLDRLVLEDIVRWEQGLHFEEEIACLQNERPLPRKSPLLQLHPFIEDGILKVGGRIRNSWTSAETKRFPILIPKESPLSRLIIVDVHLKMLHAGANATLAEIRRNFWIIQAKTLIRKHIHICIN